jgi:hypothetical protein
VRLAGAVAAREALARAFRATVEAERDTWRDDKYLAIRERHLVPLIAENARFDRELAAIAGAVREAGRRLEESSR